MKTIRLDGEEKKRKEDEIYELKLQKEYRDFEAELRSSAVFDESISSKRVLRWNQSDL